MIRNYLLIVTAFLELTCYCQQRDSLIKVTDRLYMITGLGGNVTFLTTNEGVLLVDAGTVKRDAIIISNHIKTVTDKPIKYLVLTHFHHDHAFGACGFSDKPIIVSHKNTVKNLSNSGQWLLDMFLKKNLESKVNLLKVKMDNLKTSKNLEWRQIEKEYNSNLEQLNSAYVTTFVFPDITFEKEMCIFLDSDTIKLIYPGKTHTDDNILVEFTNLNVLTTGDFLFNQCMPFIDFYANCDTECIF